jgi:hypothetical protein
MGLVENHPLSQRINMFYFSINLSTSKYHRFEINYRLFSCSAAGQFHPNGPQTWYEIRKKVCIDKRWHYFILLFNYSNVILLSHSLPFMTAPL